jgi:hypothetical protein
VVVAVKAQLLLLPPLVPTRATVVKVTVLGMPVLLLVFLVYIITDRIHPDLPAAFNYEINT